MVLLSVVTGHVARVLSTGWTVTPKATKGKNLASSTSFPSFYSLNSLPFVSVSSVTPEARHKADSFKLAKWSERLTPRWSDCLGAVGGSIPKIP